MKRISFIITLVVIFITSACKTTQLTQGPAAEQRTPTKIPKEQQLYNTMCDAYDEWDTMVAKGNISTSHFSSSFELRMIRNEGLQISVRPALGIEVVRIIITPTEMCVYEKLGRRYISLTSEELQEKIPFNITIEDIQNIFLGRPFLLGNGSVTPDDYKSFDINIGSEEWSMTPRKQYERFDYKFILQEEKLTTSRVAVAQQQGVVNCVYSNFQEQNGLLAPKTITLNLSSEQYSGAATIKFNSISWNKNTSIEKISTSRYSRVTLKELEKLMQK